MVNLKFSKQKSVKIGNSKPQRNFVRTISRKIQDMFENLWLRFIGGVEFWNVKSCWIPYWVPDFEVLYLVNELGHMLLLNINKKAYMGSPMTLSRMTLSDRERLKSRSLIFQSTLEHCCDYILSSDLERSMSRSLRFWRLICHKWTKIGHMLLIKQ